MRPTSVDFFALRTLPYIAAVFLAACSPARSNDRPMGAVSEADMEPESSHRSSEGHLSGKDMQDDDAVSTSGTNRSTLPGVCIEFTTEKTTWTAAEAASGLQIEYVVKIDDDTEGIQPVAQDAGECDMPGPSGLILFEDLRGDGHRYCLCDQGYCEGLPLEHSTLHKGIYPGAFEWDGRNWTGSSDIGVSKGDPFPPGRYTLTVSAVGRRRIEERETDFEVVGVFVFDLVEE